jgi:hypothetical protein
LKAAVPRKKSSSERKTPGWLKEWIWTATSERTGANGFLGAVMEKLSMRDSGKRATRLQFLQSQGERVFPLNPIRDSAGQTTQTPLISIEGRPITKEDKTSATRSPSSHFEDKLFVGSTFCHLVFQCLRPTLPADMDNTAFDAPAPAQSADATSSTTRPRRESILSQDSHTAREYVVTYAADLSSCQC